MDLNHILALKLAGLDFHGRAQAAHSCLFPSQLAVRRAEQGQGRGAAAAARHKDWLLHDQRE